MYYVCVQSQIPVPKQRPAVSVSTALYHLRAESDCQLAELNYKEVWIFDFKTLHRWRCWSSMIVKRLVVCWLILSNGHHLLRTNSDTLNALNLHNRNKSKTIFFWNLKKVHPCLWTARSAFFIRLKVFLWFVGIFAIQDTIRHHLPRQGPSLTLGS